MDDLVNLAHLCLKLARQTTRPTVAKELKRMAKAYQQRAKLGSGEIPDSQQGAG
jgi:hypothetical protein